MTVELDALGLRLAVMDVATALPLSRLSVVGGVLLELQQVCNRAALCHSWNIC